jgi:hypothetical protein
MPAATASVPKTVPLASVRQQPSVVGEKPADGVKEEFSLVVSKKQCRLEF